MTTAAPLANAKNALEIIKFIPIAYSPALVVAPAFSISVHCGTYFVESIKMDGESYHELTFNNFPDAIGECAKRMQEQRTVNYVTE